MLPIYGNSRIKSCRSRKNSERIANIKPFINEYNWEGIIFSSEQNDWKKCKKNDLTIALNVLYAKKEKNISCVCFKT